MASTVHSVRHAHKHTHIVSSTPSRTRLRLSEKRRTPEEVHRIATALKKTAGVHSVRVNSQTGSVVVQHDPGIDPVQNLTTTLQDLGVVLSNVLGIELPASGGKSEAATDLTSALADLNKRVGQASNGMVDLRFLVPFGLAGLSLHQLIRNGWQIEAAPWYVLAYYAFDSFIKLHYTAEHPNQQNSSQNGSESLN